MYFTLNGLNNYIFTHRALRICFIVFLILAIIFVGFATQVHAFAPALLPALYVVAAAALGAAGITFATNDEAQAAASDFLESLSDSDALAWEAMANEYVQGITDGTFVSHLSSLAISNIADWIGNLFNAETCTVDLNDVELTIDGFDVSYIPFFDYAPSRNEVASLPSVSTVFSGHGTHFPANPALGDSEVSHVYLPSVSSYPTSSLRLNLPMTSGNYDGYGFLVCESQPSTWILLVSGRVLTMCIGRVDGLYSYYIYNDNSQLCTFPIASSVDCGTSLQANSTYFPRSVVDDNPTTVFPANTATQALTTDIPLNIPASLDDVVTNTGALRGELTNTNTLLGTISAGIAAIGAAITSFFDTSQFQLDFEPLKIGLTSVFPFCIPFDFVRMVRTVAVNSSGFSFDIDLHTDYFDLDHTVDLTPFRIPILFFRFICDFWFCFILISRTRDWIKW